jgi:hypothetical protein
MQIILTFGKKEKDDYSHFIDISLAHTFNPLTPELNPSAQRCVIRFFTGDFAS